MGVASPEQMAEVFAERFNARDTKGLMELYAPDAMFTFDGESRAIGHAQIESALTGFLDAELTFSGAYVNLHVQGDVALGRMKYKLVDEKSRIVMPGWSTEVMMRGADGKWRFLIDDACGARL
jgi:uncharacterized protein (TIGR02246 family)